MKKKPVPKRGPFVVTVRAVLGDHDDYCVEAPGFHKIISFTGEPEMARLGAERTRDNLNAAWRMGRRSK